MKVIVAQIGARHHYAIPRMLAGQNRLEALYTDLCVNRGIGRVLNAILPTSMKGGRVAKLTGRRIVGVPEDRIYSTDRLLFHPSARAEQRGDVFGHAMIRWGTKEATHVYSMFGEGIDFLRFAKKRGVAICVDVFITPIAHRIIAEERRRFPEWEDAVATDQRLEQRILEIFELADLLICPAENVVEGVRALDGDAVRKTKVVPYGSGASFGGRSNEPTRGRILFAGTAELRKGIHYFAAAAEQLGASGYEFRVAGDVTERIRRLAGRSLNFLSRIPRAAMIEELLCADALVLPTLAEGSASVINEALMAGLPVITTPSAGSAVVHDQNGALVPERDVNSLAESIQKVVSDRKHRDMLASGATETSINLSESKWAKRLIEALAV